MSRSSWAWTKSGLGPLVRALSSLIAMGRVAMVVMVVVAMFPAVGLGQIGNPHHSRSKGSTIHASRTGHAAPSKPHASRRAPRLGGRFSPALMALGSGYLTPHGSRAVKLLQHRLLAAGFPAGPIDGRYGPLTRRAVIRFQASHGLQVDGIAGPVTRRALALATPVLYPGAGYGPGGSPAVRTLQQHLAAAGFSPGPADGRYGPRTQRAVRRFQQARHVRADGIAGPQTLGQLRVMLAGKPHVASHRSGSQLRRPRPNASRPGETHTRPGQAQPPNTGAPARSGSGSPPAGSSSLWIVVLACLMGAMLAVAVWLWHRARRGRALPAATPDADPDGGSAGRAQHDQPEAAFEFGVTLVQAHYRALARSAFRRPDERPHPDPEFGVLLPPKERREAAERAFRLADEQGHAAAACNLGVLLEQRGDMPGARAAYRRADHRGHAVGACNLGALLEQEGDLRGALGAYRRADERGDPKGAHRLGLLLERDGDLSGAKAAYRRAAQRGDRGAARRLDQLLTTQADQPTDLQHRTPAPSGEPHPTAPPPTSPGHHTR